MNVTRWEKGEKNLGELDWLNKEGQDERGEEGRQWGRIGSEQAFSERGEEDRFGKNDSHTEGDPSGEDT